jgi:hypothetical protein
MDFQFKNQIFWMIFSPGFMHFSNYGWETLIRLRAGHKKGIYNRFALQKRRVADVSKE